MYLAGKQQELQTVRGTVNDGLLCVVMMRELQQLQDVEFDRMLSLIPTKVHI